MPEADAVRSMFSGIAGRYDLANRLLSGGIDIYWRRVLVRSVCATKPAVVVDLATGSGDVAFALRRALPDGASVTGLDFCPPMLDEAKAKRAAMNPQPAIVFDIGDCLDLPLEDASVDALTISFGLRNLEDRHRGLREMRRVLRPGGSLFCLEFSQPKRWFRPIYYFYLKVILPVLARVVTGNRSAYEYLAGSIESFPTRESLASEMERAGFGSVSSRGLTASIVAIHKATR